MPTAIKVWEIQAGNLAEVSDAQFSQVHKEAELEIMMPARLIYRRMRVTMVSYCVWESPTTHGWQAVHVRL